MREQRHRPATGFDPLFGGVEDAPRGDGPMVVLLGDSIGVAASAALRHELTGFATKFAAVIGEGIAGGPISHLAGSGSMLEVAARYGQEPPEVGILELGTNDLWRPELSASAACQTYPQLVAALGARWVVGVLVAAHEVEDYDGDGAVALNEVIRSVADEVVDWPSIAARPGSLKADGVHPTPLGAAALASAMAAAVRDVTGRVG